MMSHMSQVSLHSQLPMVIRTKYLVGQATLHQVWPTMGDPLLARLLDSWQLQSSFSMALVTHKQQCAAAAAAAVAAMGPGAGSNGVSNGWTCSSSSPGQQQQQQQGKGGRGCSMLHGGVPTALVLCWSDKEAVVLHLPSTTTRGSNAGAGRHAAAAAARSNTAAAAGRNAAAAGDESAAQCVWSVVDQVLGNASRTVTCIGAVGLLSGLAAVGVRVRAAIDDPCAAFTLWQPTGLHSAAAAGGGGGVGVAAASAGEQQQQRHALTVVEEASKAAAAMVLGGGLRGSWLVMTGMLMLLCVYIQP